MSDFQEVTEERDLEAISCIWSRSLVISRLSSLEDPGPTELTWVARQRRSLV